MAVAYNALNPAAGYTQRWMAETAYSTVRRPQDSAIRSGFWYGQSREIVRIFGIHNLKMNTKWY